jgi:hypothetical protein
MLKRTPEDPVGQYLSEIQHNLSSGIAREQTHRPALKDLVESLDPSIDAFNDPKHIDVGAPDFTLPRSQERSASAVNPKERLVRHWCTCT